MYIQFIVSYYIEYRSFPKLFQVLRAFLCTPVNMCILESIHVHIVQIWPWLLGLYSTSSSDMECDSVRERAREEYSREIADWRKVEEVHLRLLAAAERERAERWRRECAANISHFGGFTMSREGEGEEEGDGEGGGGEGEGEGEGESGEGGEGVVHSDGESDAEEQVANGREGDGRVDDREVGRKSEGEEGEREAKNLSSQESISTVTPVPTHQDLSTHHTLIHTSSSTTATPKVLTPSPPAPPSRSPSPELHTLSDLSVITQSTASSPGTPHPPTDSVPHYIIPPQDDVITKTRSSSVDSGHSSNCNLGNSIDSSHGNNLVNGCRDDNNVGGGASVEWNGDSGGMDSRPKELALSPLPTVAGPAVGERRREEREGEGEGEGEEQMELDEKGQMFAEELLKIDKDIPRCDRDYW